MVRRVPSRHLCLAEIVGVIVDDLFIHPECLDLPLHIALNYSGNILNASAAAAGGFIEFLAITNSAFLG